MDRDYQMLGLCETRITSSAATITADTGGFMTVICLENGVLSEVTSRFPKAGVAGDTDLTLNAGIILYSISSFTIVSGTWQVIFHKS